MAFKMKPPKELLFGRKPKVEVEEFTVIKIELDDGIAG